MTDREQNKHWKGKHHNIEVNSNKKGEPVDCCWFSWLTRSFLIENPSINIMSTGWRFSEPVFKIYDTFLPQVIEVYNPFNGKFYKYVSFNK